MQHFSLMLLSNNLMCCLNINQFPVVKLQLITSVDNGWNNSIMAREQITSPATILITSSQGTFHAEKVFNKKTYEHYFLNYKQPWIFFLFFFFSPNNKRGRGCVGTITVHITKFNLPHYSKKAPEVILYLHHCFHKYHLKCTHFAQCLDSTVEVKQHYFFHYEYRAVLIMFISGV